MGRLDGKVAIVTGGASGIGRGAVVAFVEEGARVYVADLDAAGIGGLVSELGHNYVDGTATDTTDEAAVQKMVDGCVRRFGRLDVALNNVGIGGFSPIQDYPAEDFRRVVDVCLAGTFLCIKHESRHLIDAGHGGSIINIASLNATQPTEGFAAYCSAKAGVAMLTEVAALELGRRGIRVNAIGPGTHRDPGDRNPALGPRPRAGVHRRGAHGPRRAAGRCRPPRRLPGVGRIVAHDRPDPLPRRRRQPAQVPAALRLLRRWRRIAGRGVP
ncbi:MAG: SDR family oxidoreductase [Dehalococcoidia bacterium]|nr:SDR family oxidoreductase [Dehalococcoidia bacterium]